MKIRNIALCGLSSALMALCAWISVPIFDIAFTMQSFAVFFALFVLGGKWGSAAILVYLCLGIAGLPVFSNFQGGLGALLGVTGGFLWGFLLCGLCYWLLSSIFGKKWNILWAAVSMLLCYGCGCIWFYAVYGDGSALGLGAVILKCVVPYLLPDALKIYLSWQLSRRLKRYII